MRLPEKVKAPLRRLRTALIGPSARDVWVKDVYTDLKIRKRRELMVSIARFHHISNPTHGYYMEFGCNSANSARDAWDGFRHLFDWHFLFFDTFEGFPELAAIDRQAGWKKGTAAMTEKDFIATCVRHGMPRARFTTIKGDFAVSLTDELAKRFTNKAAVIYIDCDLYHSTVPVLKFIPPYLQQGTVIVFDDWNCYHADPNKGERRAWREFTEANPRLRFERFFGNGEHESFVFAGEQL